MSVVPDYVRAPRVPELPHDASSMLIDGRVDWLAAAVDGVELDDCALTLALKPELVRQFGEDSGSFGGLVAPLTVATAADGSVFALSRARRALRRFDPCCCRFVDVPCFGDKGSGPRELRNPGGIAVCGQTLYVCDRGLDGLLVTGTSPWRNAWREKLRRANHRVTVLRLPGYELHGHLRPPLHEFARWKPEAVACDRRGCVWVTDSHNGVVHRFDRRGFWRDAKITGLENPRQIAIDGDDRVYVVDCISVDSLEPERTASLRVFGSDGVAVATPDTPAALRRHRTCFPPLAFAVAANGDIDLRALATGECCDTIGVFDPTGEPAPVPVPPATPWLASGTYLSHPLDSRIRQCQWHRVTLHGELPAGARAQVETFCADELYDDDQLAAHAEWSQREIVPAATRTPVSHDALVASAPGRYLWLKLTLAASAKPPRITAIELEFPRLTSLRYLPAVYAAEPTSADFTARYLALFDTVLGDIERALDTQSAWFDPASAPSERRGTAPIDMLGWLASWLGIGFERGWPVARRRAFLKQAGAWLAQRGTVRGLRGMLLLALGWQPPPRCEDSRAAKRCTPVEANCHPCGCAPPYSPPPLILEHFRLRRWLLLGQARLGAQAVLWGRRIVNRSQLGANAQNDVTQLITTPDPTRDPLHYYAHRYTVFLPACAGGAEAERRRFQQLLRGESPAEARWDIAWVEPRFRIGVQSMIGFDAVVGGLPPPARVGDAQLGGPVLVAAARDAGAALRIGRAGRLGTSAQLT